MHGRQMKHREGGYYLSNSDEDVLVLNAPADTCSSSSNSDEEGMPTGAASGDLASFRSFQLRPELMKAIRDLGFSRPSLAQQDALPPALEGRDLLCQAKNGSGKTAVFALATLQNMDFGDFLETVIVVPTRELAVQVTDELKQFGKYIPNCRPMAVYGGVPQRAQRYALYVTVPNILVGTPGRLYAMLDQRLISFRQVKFFVFDECDILLDNPRRDEMYRHATELLAASPEDRQVMMFTTTLATTRSTVEKRFLRLMHCPYEVVVEQTADLTLRGVLQYRVELRATSNGTELFRSKTAALQRILDQIEFNQVVVFVNRVERCEPVAAFLRGLSYSTTIIHSGMGQDERLRHFHRFRQFRARLLVASDLMGRGIDVRHVNVIINFDVPLYKSVYLNRVGRTGRMDRAGLAISLCAKPLDKLRLAEFQQHFDIHISELPDSLDPQLYIE